MPDKLRILIVAAAMDVGGIENQLMHLLRRCDKSRFQIDFTSTDPDAHYLPEIRSLGGQVHLIPRAKTQGQAAYCRALYRVMKEGHYDIIHSHELFHSGMVLLLARLAGIPHRFVHAHNWDDGDGSGRKRSAVRTAYNAVMRFTINRFSTCRIACSTLAGRFLYGKRDFHLLFNSVDTGKFLKHYHDAETGEFCGGWTNVLHVGRVTAVKNQLFLVEVAEELRRRGTDIRILCAGNGDPDYQSRVETAIREKGLQDRIRLLGVRRDIDVLMRKSAAFVLPSKYEGMPLVLIEAQASGLPCVSADTFSQEVDFGIGTLSWLPADTDAKRWADAIEAAVRAGRAEKAAVQRAVAEKGFDSDSFARKLCELYTAAQEGTS